jgi:hypothetical protein
MLKPPSAPFRSRLFELTYFSLPQTSAVVPLRFGTVLYIYKGTFYLLNCKSRLHKSVKAFKKHKQYLCLNFPFKCCQDLSSMLDVIALKG